LFSGLAIFRPAPANADARAADDADSTTESSHAHEVAEDDESTQAIETSPPLMVPPVDSGEARRYWLSVRPSIGVGAGDVGIAGRFGAASEYWFSDWVGVGLEAGLFGQLTPFGPGFSAGAIAPTLAIRTAAGSEYVMAALGAGYADVSRLTGDGCRHLIITSDCRRLRYGGYTLTAAFGYVGHPSRSSFEFGPVARLDAVGDFSDRVPLDYLVTFNIELGFGLRR
jgi:hypothetical protein